jgi:hypothetical protein
MACRGRWALIVLVLAIPAAATAADFGPGEAAAGAPAPRSTQPAQPGADFRVLVWYHRKDPLGTFKYEVYDLRQGQNTAAIDAWVDEVRAKYPAYVLQVRDLRLERLQGATESLKVGSVIKRELMVAAGMAGIDSGGEPRLIRNPGSGTSLAAPSFSTRDTAQTNQRPPGPQIDRSYLNSNPTLYPRPVPYPRLPP